VNNNNKKVKNMHNVEKILIKLRKEESFSIIKDSTKDTINNIQVFMNEMFNFLSEKYPTETKDIMEQIDKRYKIESTEARIDFVSVV